MELRRLLRQVACKPKWWIGLLVAGIAIVSVGRAVSQPAAKSARNQRTTPAPADVQPLPATDSTSDEPVFNAYLPEGDVEAAARELRSQFGEIGGFRVAPDPRSGKLLIMAPPSVHKQLAAKLQAAPESNASGTEKTTVPPAQKTLTLKNTKPRDFEAALSALARRQLPVSVDRNGQVASYTLTSRAGAHVTLAVDRTAGQITIDGPGDLVAGWVRVSLALDSPQQSKTEQSRVVPVHDATPAARGAIQRALTIIGRQVNETTVDTTGQLVSLRLQPREGAAAPGAGAAGGNQAAQPGVQAQPPGPNTQPPAQPGEATEDAGEGGGLIGPVQIEFLEGLDQIVIRGNPRDVERVIEIIRQIEAAAVETAPDIEVVNLRYVTSEAMSSLLSTIYDQVLAPRYGRVTITPLVKPNALLLIGRTESIQEVIKLIRRLDQAVPPESQFQVFPLRHTAANEAEATIREYLSGGAPQTGVGAAAATQAAGLGTRGVVIADYRTNSLIVRASARDLEEIDLLIKKIDVPTSAAVNELRVFTLRNSLAEELAPVLQNAITGQTQQVRGQQGQQGGGQFQQFQQQQQQFQGQQGQQRAGQQQQTRSTMLQFFTLDAQGRRTLRSGILTDVRITADTTGNTLIVSAPADSMDLIGALIAQLDQIPTSTAQIKVFTIQNGDAQSLMTMLQQLFGLQQTGAAGGRGQQGIFQQFIVPEGEGNPLVTLRFSVDTRTNSIIASGSAGDLAVVEAILLRLDESDVRQRKSIVYRLKNAPATDVANTINQYLTSQRQIQQAFGTQLVSPFEQIEREVVVVPEVVSNSLIISATPRYFDEIRTIIEQLDARPPMVTIQVLIAEITLTNTDEFGVELGLQDSVLFDRSLLDNIQQLTNTTTFGDPPTTVQEQRIVSATNNPGFLFNNSPLGNAGSANALQRSNVVGTQGLSHFAVGRTNNELGFGGLVLSASSESVSFLLRALSESRRLDVLARPQVTTLENQPAFVQVGQRVPRITSSTPSTLGGVTNQFTLENVGLILLVTPRVSPDGLVVMDIHAERSEVGPEAEGIPVSITPTGEAVRSPRINSTVAETTVSALNGQTLVLGGLITKTKNETHRRVPLLSEIPVLGHLFRYDNVQNRRTELLIVMTPRVIRNKEDADIIKQVEAARMSWCLADVIKIHGESGLRGRNADWTDAETTVIYPTVPHELLDSMVPGSAEEIVSPPPSSVMPGTAPPTSPPPTNPPPGGGRLPPPTSPPPGPAPTLRIPMSVPSNDPPPTLPSGDSGARLQRPAVHGPTLAPVQADSAQLRPVQNQSAPAVQNAMYAEAVRGSFYTNANQPVPDSRAQQAIYQPPQGENRQAVYELPVR